MTLIGPSLMCADMGNLRDNVIRLDQAGVDYFHFDIMDGRFVLNFWFGC
jgi:ribulose-phosphate 3-epimerase